MKKTNTSVFTGVFWDRNAALWLAAITVHSKNIYLSNWNMGLAIVSKKK